MLCQSLNQCMQFLNLMTSSEKILHTGLPAWPCQRSESCQMPIWSAVRTCALSDACFAPCCALSLATSAPSCSLRPAVSAAGFASSAARFAPLCRPDERVQVVGVRAARHECKANRGE